MKLSRTLTVLLGSAAALAVTAAPALGAVSYSPATGGFAGKGDVMTALSISSNEALLAAAPGIVFTYGGEQTYAQVCSREQVTKKETKVIEATKTYTLSVPNQAVLESVRKNKTLNVTGFNLKAATGDVPAAPSDLCNNAPTHDNGMTWYAEDEDGNATTPSLTSQSGGLTVQNGTGATVPLPNTPVVLAPAL